jgi:FdhD protein
MTTGRVRIGVSACLLGDAVRFDGGHKRNDVIVRDLADIVEWVRVCPEVEVGMGTPREPVRLVRAGGDVRMIATRTGIDHTASMNRWAQQRADSLSGEDISGYVFKKDSPSCGVSGVKVFDDRGSCDRSGRGLFAAALISRFPGMPVAEEDELSDPVRLREFLERVTAYSRARAGRDGAVPSAGDPRPVRSMFQEVPVVRVGRDGGTSDTAAVEEPLEIRLHGKPFAVIMRTPGSDRALAAGFLLSEGVITGADDIGAVEHCRHPLHPEGYNVVDVYLLGGAAGALDERLAGRRQVVTGASCGLCGRLSIETLARRAAPLEVAWQMDARIAAGLPEGLRARQDVFDVTGGLHAAGLFTTDGKCIGVAEDVGRHSAVDKVVGAKLLDDELPLAGAALAVSGRTSFEIVQKAWLAGIGLVCAVSAPTTLAVALAEEAGITLLGFARDGGFNIYAHPQRVARS